MPLWLLNRWLVGTVVPVTGIAVSVVGIPTPVTGIAVLVVGIVASVVGIAVPVTGIAVSVVGIAVSVKLNSPRKRRRQERLLLGRRLEGVREDGGE